MATITADYPEHASSLVHQITSILGTISVHSRDQSPGDVIDEATRAARSAGASAHTSQTAYGHWFILQVPLQREEPHPTSTSVGRVAEIKIPIPWFIHSFESDALIKWYKHKLESIRPVESDSESLKILGMLESMLVRKYQQTGQMEDMDEVISTARDAAKLIPDGDPRRGSYLKNLGDLLGQRYDKVGDEKDLDEAFVLVEEAVRITPTSDPNRGVYLDSLASMYFKKYELKGVTGDLDKALGLSTEAVSAVSTKNDWKATCLKNLGTWLFTKYELDGAETHRELALSHTEEAVGLIPTNHPGRGTYLGHLAAMLHRMYNATENMDHLRQAIARAKESMEFPPLAGPGRASRLTNLGTMILSKYKRTRQPGDLQEAIRLAKDAENVVRDAHLDRARYLSSLGDILSENYRRAGKREDLEEAIRLGADVVKATPLTHTSLPSSLASLGNRLAMRYQADGSVVDLQEAIARLEHAISLISDTTPPDLAIYLESIGKMLLELYNRTNDKNCLDQALHHIKRAVEVTSGHPKQGYCLNSLSVCFLRHYEAYNNTEYLRQAIFQGERALSATDAADPDRCMYLGHLGITLFRMGTAESVRRGIDLVEEAERLSLPDHPMRPILLYNLGRFRSDHSQPLFGNLGRALHNFSGCWECENAQPSLRINAAREAGIILMAQERWNDASTILADAVHLLPEVSPRSLKQNDQQYALQKFAGLATLAASAALRAGKTESEAVTLLEFGRGVISGLLFGMRTEITDLRETNRELADRFERFRDILDSSWSTSIPDPASNELPLVTESNRRHEASIGFKETVVAIRLEPGFEDFLQPPTEDKLKSAASLGPVVIINVSGSHCDAILIKSTGLERLPLPLLHQSDIEEKVKRMGCQTGQVMNWLWETVASLVLNALGYQEQPADGGRWPHVWWVPTGMLSLLPLHAAGPTAADCVLDRVVSSYSPSIRALLHGREDPNLSCERALLASMEKTPGCHDLRFAEEEIRCVKELLGPSISSRPLRNPSKADVLSKIGDCAIFHFAGHGVSDTKDPSKSSLLLRDERVTVEDLISVKLYQKPPWIAYLSACSTGQSTAMRLHDEAIHLITACQLAGFRHVVGSLWEVSDSYSVDAARVFYTALQDVEKINDEVIALGVHKAARHLRQTCGEQGKPRALRPPGCLEDEDDDGGQFLFWAAYIHVGP